MGRSERMATVDAAWLHMDGPDNRMMITAVLELDGRLAWGTLAGILQQRLVERYPRFGQRMVHGALGEARWEEDSAFDLRNHLHRVGVPSPGGRQGLQFLVSQLASSPLDPDRPPWQVHLVDDGERTAMIVRIHHAVADGMSLGRVLLSLSDDRAGDVDAAPTTAPGGGGERRLGALLRAPALAGERLVEAGRGMLAHREELLELTAEQLVGAARLGGSSAGVARKLLSLSDDPQTVLKGPLCPVKRMAWHDGVALDRVKVLAKKLGGTVNDVLLAALAEALSRYLREHGDRVGHIRTLVPVNLRPVDRPIPTSLGNRFGLVFLELPVEHLPARQRFAEVKARMDALKRSTEPAVTHAILSAVGLSPVQVERLVVDVFGAKVSLITTNVPGPKDPLALGGCTVDRILFWVPQSGAVALGVSLFSYAGRVAWGVSADAGRVREPERIVEGFLEALEELER